MKKKTLFIACIFAMGFISSFSKLTYAQAVQLVWSVSEYPAISHYGIYRANNIDSNFVLINTVNHPDSIYLDSAIQLGTTYFFTTTSVDTMGNESVYSEFVEVEIPNTTAVNANITSRIPDKFSLFQNYPNPFNPTTTISYNLPQSSHVTLTIYNNSGQEVSKLVDYFQHAGEYSIQWNGNNNAGIKVGSGVYYYQIRAGNQRVVKKMLLLK